MTLFDEIRSYRDDEVRGVIDKILLDPGFLAMVSRYLNPKLAKWFSKPSAIITKMILQKKLQHVETVAQLQEQIELMLSNTIRNTASGISFSGIENLSYDMPSLYISNHRDIVLDPALVNLSLYKNGMQTPHLAIGDNLLTYEFVSDLMRLNKSFIVKRASNSGPREKYKIYQTLSAYIKHLLDQGESVWIAQREGRAKDGDDITDVAIIKMLFINGKVQDIEFSDYFNALNIIPVAISYEYDPCDAVKAEELLARKKAGSYQKAKNEDMLSIAQGIQEYKGHIHVAFGKRLQNSRQISDVSSELDRQIHNMYRLYPCHVMAWQKLYATTSKAPVLDLKKMFPNINLEKKKDFFHKRLADYPEEIQNIIYSIYAQPVSNYLKVKNNSL